MTQYWKIMASSISCACSGSSRDEIGGHKLLEKRDKYSVSQCGNEARYEASPETQHIPHGCNDESCTVASMNWEGPASSICKVFPLETVWRIQAPEWCCIPRLWCCYSENRSRHLQRETVCNFHWNIRIQCAKIQVSHIKCFSTM